MFSTYLVVSFLIFIVLFFSILSFYMVFLKNRNTEKRKTKIINKFLFLLCFLLLISISILIGVYLGVLTTVKSVVIAFIALVFILSLFFMAFSVNCAILDSILSLNKRL